MDTSIHVMRASPIAATAQITQAIDVRDRMGPLLVLSWART